MTITRRTLINSAVATAAAGQSLLTSRPSSAQTPSGTLRFVPEFDLQVLDPIANTGLSTLQHGYLVYDTLFSVDRTYTPRPQMVDKYAVSDDGRTYDFTLRDGLRFHDGAAVRAQDCVASIRRWGARDVMGRAIMARLDSLVASDEKSFRLKLKEPYPILIDAFAKVSSNVCFIMREREASTDPNTLVKDVVGSGPFRFVANEFVPGSKVVYARNEAYVPRQEPSDGYSGGKHARVNRVEWNIIGDANTQLSALIAGEVDLVSGPPLDLLPMLARDRNVVIKHLDQQGWAAYIRPNHIHPPFNDIRARRALAHLVDQSDYLNAAAGDKANWTECRAFMVCGSPMESQAGMEAYAKADLVKAKALLAESGYNGEPLVVLDPTDNPILGALSQITIGQLRKIGANVQPVSTDLATAFARRASRNAPTAGGWHIFHTRSLGVELNNPLTSFPLASPCSADAQGNRAGWFGWSCDEKLEQLREQWTKAASLDERKKVAVEIQRRAAEHLPFIPLGQMRTPVAHRANVRGLIEMPIVVFWNVALG